MRIRAWPRSSLLHGVVSANLPGFMVLARKRGMGVWFIERAFLEYLQCGDVKRGHADLECETCGHAERIALSCKRRGVCPACGARRMAAGAARLVDKVLPVVPYRHWVVSYPFAWNMKLAFRPELLDAVERLVARVLAEWHRRRGEGGKTGFVLFRHRFNSDLAIHMHVHVLIFDGVYRRYDDGSLRFEPGAEATKKELKGLARELLAQLKALVKGHEQGIDVDDKSGKPRQRTEQLEMIEPADGAGLREPQDAGASLVVQDGEGERPAAGRYVRAEDLHVFASEVIPGEDRARLEQLCGYLLRPAFDPDRLAQRPDGVLTYRLSKPDKHGNTMLVMRPVEFMMRLASLIPAPKLPTVRYYGMLAAGSRDRGVVGPLPAEKVLRARWAMWLPLAPLATVLPLAPLAALLYCGLLPEEGFDDAAKRQLSKHDGECWHRWESMLRRLWGIEQLTCPRCGGRMRPTKVHIEPIATGRSRKTRGASRWARGPPELWDAVAQPQT